VAGIVFGRGFILTASRRATVFPLSWCMVECDLSPRPFWERFLKAGLVDQEPLIFRES